MYNVDADNLDVSVQAQAPFDITRVAEALQTDQ